MSITLKDLSSMVSSAAFFAIKFISSQCVLFILLVGSGRSVRKPYSTFFVQDRLFLVYASF